LAPLTVMVLPLIVPDAMRPAVVEGLPDALGPERLAHARGPLGR